MDKRNFDVVFNIEKITYRWLLACFLLTLIALVSSCSEPMPTTNKPVTGKLDNRKLSGSTLQLNATFNQALYDSASLVRGGQLYDNWFNTAAQSAPETINPVWSLLGHTSVPVADTWRCSSCHGWDYLGANGALGDTNNPLHTGINGIVPATNQTGEQAIWTFIRDGAVNDNTGQSASHAFINQLPESDIYALSKFVSTVRNEASTNISPLSLVNNKTRIQGNQAVGSSLFNASIDGSCASCHGANGTAIAGVNVRLAAESNPAQTLHQVRFGIASTTAPMPGLLSNQNLDPDISLRLAGDITAFAAHGVQANHIEGGRLYDDWVVETGIDTATLEVNPLWSIAPDQASIPAGVADDPHQSWLCSNCHGFDFEGGRGFAANNLVELKHVRGWAPGDPDNFLYVYNFLMEGFPALINGTPMMVHSYAHFLTADPAATPGLTEAEFWDLADFAVEETVDTHQYLQPDTGTAVGSNGNPAVGSIGREIFDGPGPTIEGQEIDCAMCHGLDGLAIAAVHLPTLAWEDPWRVFHRIRFGSPRPPGTVLTPPFDPANTVMPGLLEFLRTDGTPTDNHDGVDVLEYMQLDLNGMPTP